MKRIWVLPVQNRFKLILCNRKHNFLSPAEAAVVYKEKHYVKWMSPDGEGEWELVYLIDSLD